MKTPLLVAVAVAASAATSAIVHFVLEPRAERQPESALAHAPDSDADLGALREEVQGLARALEDHRREVAARLESLARQPVAPAVAAGTPRESDAPLALTAVANGGVVNLADRSAEELFELLWNDSLGSGANEELWNELARRGRTQELIALFEAEAAKNPNDPDVHVKLAGGYIRMIQEVGQSPLAGTWATKADKTYDRALELDPHHVEARLSKAVSLSFWPPIFGKAPAAVKQFEILIEQLDGQPLQPTYAQAWTMLGNLHAQSGQHEAAQAVWQQGAALFPDDATLKAKLE